MVHRVLLALGLICGSVASAASLSDIPSSASMSAGEGFSSSALLKRTQTRTDYPSISAPDSLIRLTSGDQLRLRWWGIGSGDLDLVVDTRGDLVIPDMGRIPTRDRNFREIRDSIEAMLKRRIKPNLIDLQIVKVGNAKVRISGMIPRPGLYDCQPGTHVSQMLRMAGLDPTHGLDSLTSDLPGLYYALDDVASLRNILVIRGGKDSVWVDLMRALRAGDPSQDPILFDGDAVRVMPRGSLVSVSGGSFSGYVEMLPGESIGALLAATGETDSARPVELMNSRGELRKVVPKDTHADSTIALIRVPLRHPIFLPSVVWIVGQVNHPGAYPFSQGMRANDLVKLAGGIIGGDDSGVVVGTKKGWNWLAAAREKSLADNYQIPELKVAMIDYVNHMRGNYSDPEVQIQIGDSIYVYKAEHVVWVAGKVGRPGFVPWKKGANVAYYVNAAGGYAPRAWESRTQVFDWQTLQTMGIDQPVRPGSAVVVPEERFISPDQWFSIAATTASLMIAVASLMLQVSK